MSPDSSALVIKREYKRLARTWHPDKWPAGTSEQQRAGERMREVNEAYALVRHAPLRYHLESHPRVTTRAERTGRPAPAETLPLGDYAEYAIRFAWGAAFGLFVLAVMQWAGAEVPTIAWVVVPVVTGTLAAVYGDRFWFAVLESFWWIDLF